jgi:hypothetical protein
MFASSASGSDREKRIQSLIKLIGDHDAFSTSLKNLPGGPTV